MSRRIRILIETLILPILRRRLGKHKKPLSSPFDFKRIAVMKFASLGDYVLANHAIKALKLKYPEARITFICDNRKNSKIFENSPYIDSFEYIDVFDKSGNFRHPLSPVFLKDLILLYFRSWRRRFDVLVNLNIVESTFVLIINMMAVSAARAKITAGLDTDDKGFFYDISIRDSFSGEKADLYTYLELVSLLGARERRELEGIPTSLEVKDRVGFFLNDFMQGRKNALVCLHSGSNVRIKMWPAESFAELGNSLIKNYNVKILLVGAKSEIGLGETIAALLKEDPINLIGKTTLQELAALIKSSSLFIGNNSAPMQIAVTEDVPTIGIIGPGLNRYYSYEEKHFRYVKSNSDCSFVKDRLECLKTDCPTRECMKSILAANVMLMVDNMQEEGVIDLRKSGVPRE